MENDDNTSSCIVQSEGDEQLSSPLRSSSSTEVVSDGSDDNPDTPSNDSEKMMMQTDELSITAPTMNEYNDIPRDNGDLTDESSDESDDSVCSVIETTPYNSPKFSPVRSCDGPTSTLKRTTSKDNLQLEDIESQSFEPMYAFMGNMDPHQGYMNGDPPPSYEVDDNSHDLMNRSYLPCHSSKESNSPIGPMCVGNVFYSKMNNRRGRDASGAPVASTSYANYDEHERYAMRPFEMNIIPHSFETDAPFVTLTSKENSCPFVERRISLYKPIKVGRAIAKTRPAVDNAIFDCKVLSRNHALIWFQDGKFFLKDTQSSNGTFINSVRLSTANEKSQPYELFSRDMVQFGVEVTEKKNVHSCVIATIRLYYPDGVEAPRKTISDSGQEAAGKSSIFNVNYVNSSVNVTPSQMIEMSFFVKDAMNKQALLEIQLEKMRQMMKNAMEMSKQNWAALVDEDRLLSRIQELQSQIQTLLIVNSKEETEESKVALIKVEMLNLIADKEKFESYSKTALQKALDEKLTAVTNLQAIEMELGLKEEACKKLNSTLKDNLTEMKTLSSFCEKIKKENEELQEKIKQIEEDYRKQLKTIEQERNGLQAFVANLQSSESELQTKMNQLKETSDTAETIDLHEHLKSENLLGDKETKNLTNGDNLKQDINQDENLNLLSDSVYQRKMQKLSAKCVVFEKVFEELNNRFDTFNTMIKSMCYQLVTFGVKIEEIQEKLLHRRRADHARLVALIEKESQLETTNRGLDLSVQLYEEVLEKKDREIEQYKCDIVALNKRFDEYDSTNEDKMEQAIQISDHVDHGLKLSASLDDILTQLNLDDNANSNNIAPDSDLTKKLISQLRHLNKKYKQSKDDNFKLSEELIEMQDQYSSLSYQNDLSFFVAVCPLLIIIIAIVTAFYPILSALMGTTGA